MGRRKRERVVLSDSELGDLESRFLEYVRGFRVPFHDRSLDSRCDGPNFDQACESLGVPAYILVDVVLRLEREGRIVAYARHPCGKYASLVVVGEIGGE